MKEVRPFLDFDGKLVVVTGASSGLGRAIAVELSHYAARLVIMGRDKNRLDATAAMLDPCECEGVCLDLSNHAEVFPAISDVCKKMGRFYGLCHCAGTVETRPLASYKIEKLQAMMDINLIAGMELARAICHREHMEETGGSLLFIASVYSKVGMAGQTVYSATKGAVAAMARALAMELARRKIRVNVLSPGLVRTAMIAESFTKLSEKQVQDIESSFPLGTGTPEDVAKAAAFLLAPQSRWITGVNLSADGGYTAQ